MLSVNGFHVNATIFPDKSSQVWKLPNELITQVTSSTDNIPVANIKWIFEGDHEVFQVMQLVSLLHEIVPDEITLNLDVPYMPYGRQDKRITNQSCFALQVFSMVLMMFDEVTTFDLHNPQSLAEFEFIKNVMPTEKIKAIIEEHRVDSLVFPDKGALARYGSLVSNIETFSADKVRDQLTGDITGLKMDTTPKEGATILVQDDICDGGRSFTELAKLLLPLSPSKLILYVSHGIFSKGTQCIFDAGYTHIYTRDGAV